MSCWYSLESSRWVLSDEYPFAMVSVIFSFFLYHFVLAKLATGSIRVNITRKIFHRIHWQHSFLSIISYLFQKDLGILLRGNLLSRVSLNVEVFFYWPEAVIGNFYWPGASSSLLASSPGSQEPRAPLNCPTTPLKFLQGAQWCTGFYAQYLKVAFEDAIGLPEKKLTPEY